MSSQANRQQLGALAEELAKEIHTEEVYCAPGIGHKNEAA